MSKSKQQSKVVSMKSAAKTDETAFVSITTKRGNTYQFPKKYVTPGASVSSIIRAMTADGWSKANIAKTCNLRYQHVRNVLMEPTAK